MLFNVRVDTFTTETALKSVETLWDEPFAHTLFFVNAHCFNIAQKDNDYRRMLHEADMVLNDGSGLAIAGRLSGNPFSENMNGTDLIPRLIELAALTGRPAYFLGGTAEVAERVRGKVSALFPEMRQQAHHGYFSQDEELVILEQIAAQNTALLVVGFGAPKQEKWIAANLNKLPDGCVAVAGGGFFDFYTEKFVRAPGWARRIGIEWVWRLAQEPGRMWKRYIIGNAVFLLRCFMFKVKGRTKEI